jgi:hypothetical protein
MGYGAYSQDIAHQSRAVGPQWVDRGEVHASLNPKVGPREVNNATPMVVAMDVTRSRGDDTKRLYDQLPKLMERIAARAYVEGPGISFAAVGDAFSDKAPLQVSQFEADNRLDQALAAMWIEEGGGGTGQESYELAAWYYAGTDCVQQRLGRGGKGFFFFVGDEGFYPQVSGAARASVLGQEAQDLDSVFAFRSLQEKFHTFLIYPGKSMDERKSDIDAEIRRRVLAAGGQHDNVDVRVSLVWDNRNDLDLHVFAPSGEEISYRSKVSACGGMLDVDRNVGGETRTPVENVRWVRGTAPEGQYRVYVQNFRFHESDKAPTPFRLEVEVGGELQFFEGEISPNKETGTLSDVVVCSFNFAADAAARKAQYAAYSDEVVLRQWESVLPAGHILRLRDAQNITLVLLGALGIASGRETLASYEAKLHEDGATAEAIADVRAALQGVRALR